MSKTQGTRSTKAESNGRATLPFLAAEYEGRKVTIRRNSDYQETLASVKRVFSSLQSTANKLIFLCARFEELDDIVQITEELWRDVLPMLVLVKVVLVLQPPSQSACTGIQIFLKISNQNTMSIEAFRDSTVGTLKSQIEEKAGISFDHHGLAFDGEHLEDDRTLADYNIQEGSTLGLVYIFPRGKKPVMYLLSPVAISNIQVQLSLVKSWNFSALYPFTAISVDKSLGLGQSVTWTVDAKPDGTLFDHGARREVAYLFWEAEGTSKLLPSPASSRPSTPIAEPNTKIAPAFDPSHPDINASNAALLPFDKVTEYIDDVLLALGLHTEARTSFITYWLPDLQKHAFIALRFLPQDQYEAAAPLKVTPAPEVTTRVFMLFKGVNESELELWQSAQSMAREDANIWRDVVGVNLEKAQDMGLFRVLEWGGMEIK